MTERGIFSCRRRRCSKRRVCFHSNQYFYVPQENVNLSNEQRVLRLKISVQGPFNAFEGPGHRLEPLLDSKGRQFTQLGVVTRRLHDQKPWPVVT